LTDLTLRKHKPYTLNPHGPDLARIFADNMLPSGNPLWALQTTVRIY